MFFYRIYSIKEYLVGILLNNMKVKLNTINFFVNSLISVNFDVFWHKNSNFHIKNNFISKTRYTF